MLIIILPVKKGIKLLSKPIQGPLSFWGPGAVDYSAWLMIHPARSLLFIQHHISLKLQTIYNMSIAVTC